MLPGDDGRLFLLYLSAEGNELINCGQPVLVDEFFQSAVIIHLFILIALESYHVIIFYLKKKNSSVHGRHFEMGADGGLRASDKITVRGEGAGTA